MNETHPLIEYGVLPLEEYPAEIRGQIEADPVLLAAWQQQRDMARMMSLKTYEKPEATALERSRHAIRSHIGQEPSAAEQKTIQGPWGNWRLGVAAAAAVVCMFGLAQKFLLPPVGDAPGEPPAVADAPGAAPTMEVIHLDAFTTVPTGPVELSPALQEQMARTALSLQQSNDVRRSQGLQLPSLQPVSDPAP